MQIVSSRIWIRVTNSIYIDNNRYAKHNVCMYLSIYLSIYLFSYLDKELIVG